MNGDQFTVKEIVVEIRDSVHRLEAKVDRIDREGPIGTRSELKDHEDRLRALEEGGHRFSGMKAGLALAFTSAAALSGLVLALLNHAKG